MSNKTRITFDRFCLDTPNECLWEGSQAIKLRPKVFAVLDYLLGRPGQLVTKDEFLEALWPGTFVGDGALKVVIRQLRDILGDDPKAPRFIETAHRRGYRFIGQIHANAQSPAILIHSTRNSAQPVVGRDNALFQLQGWIEKTLAKERQVVFVTGEAGIGKTALVETFAHSIASEVRVARGQCLEQYGTGEAYLPVLEAIGRLCREHPPVVDVLRTHAPTWLLQLPSLISVADHETLSRELSKATKERMLREMGDALEILTADMPLVLILEDLHWSDYSTLDLISYLARHRQAAQMMLIGTYRPVELIVSGHPLKAVKSELLAKQQCKELLLDYLSRDSIERYLSIRFPVHRFPGELAALIHDRTEGSPLFMVNAVDYLVAEGLIKDRDGCWALTVEIEKVQVGVPDSIKQMIEKQIDHLDADEQRTLEAASVAGAEFSLLAVAAGLEQDETLLAYRCDELVRRHHFIQDRGVQELSNGQIVHRYGFIHALYQNVLYDRLSTFRRAQLHHRIGDWSEAFYGVHAPEFASELAMHFDRGAAHKQAVKYLRQAAENDIRRFAYREAIGLSRRALELIKRLPDSPERSRQELGLHVTLGVPLIATEGYAAAEAGSTYARARELCRQLGEAPEISQVLWGLWTFHLVRASLGTAREIAEEFSRVAERVPYSGLAMEVTLIHLGEFVPAMEHCERALSLYDPDQHRDDVFRYSQNSTVASQSHAAWALWFIGQPDGALDRMQKAIDLAHELSEPHGLAHAFFFSAILHQLRKEKRLAQEHAEASLAIATEHRLLLYQAIAPIARAWATIEPGQQEKVEEIRRGLAAHRATGTELLRPHFLGLLSEALHIAGQSKEALDVVDDALALADRTGERYYQAELYRLKGELLLIESTEASANAEKCFQQSLKIAKQQNAKSVEVRTATNLGRHYRNQGRFEEARALLTGICSSFSEGFETSDMCEAKALLHLLSSSAARQK